MYKWKKCGLISRLSFSFTIFFLGVYNALHLTVPPDRKPRPSHGDFPDMLACISQYSRPPGGQIWAVRAGVSRYAPTTSRSACRAASFTTTTLAYSPTSAPGRLTGASRHYQDVFRFMECKQTEKCHCTESECCMVCTKC